MPAGRQTMTVIDLRYDGEDKNNPQAFVVKGATNIITYRITQYLSAREVQGLIRNGVRVTVVPKLSGVGGCGLCQRLIRRW
jgi:hypothetical protein